MQNYEFVLWLEGYLDLCPNSTLNTKKLRIIRNHLNLVKAVTGRLGPLNQKIYDETSAAIERDDQKFSNLFKENLQKKIANFLKESFPESKASQ